MAKNLTLNAIRRALTGLPGSDVLIEQQAGLIVRLWQAASCRGDAVDDVASALAIGWLEAGQLHGEGKKTGYARPYLGVLRGASSLGLRYENFRFTHQVNSALASVYLDEEIEMVGWNESDRGFGNPLLILEAKAEAGQQDPLKVSQAGALADIEVIDTSEAADKLGVCARAVRYRKAKARAAAAVQGDLFGVL